MQDVASGAGEGALVTRFHFAFERNAGFFRREPGIHRHRRCFFGEENPVALLFRQISPRDIDVVTHGHEDVAQVLPLPGRGPGSHRALADGQARVGDHQRFGDVVNPPQPVTLRARALRGVGREVFGIQHRLSRRITAGPRVKHANQARQGRHTAHRRTSARRAPLLLQGHGRRQAFDGIDVRYTDLVDQPPRIRRHGFEIAALRFGVEGRERQRRLARTGDTGEHHQRIARNVDIDVLEVVFPGSTHPDHAGGRVGGALGCHRVALIRY